MENALYYIIRKLLHYQILLHFYDFEFFLLYYCIIRFYIIRFYKPHKLAGYALYICHPLCSVKEKNKICSTLGWFIRLLIPEVGHNSFISPSYPHSCSLLLSFLFFLFLGPCLFCCTTAKLGFWFAEAHVFPLSFSFLNVSLVL